MPLVSKMNGGESEKIAVKTYITKDMNSKVACSMLSNEI